MGSRYANFKLNLYSLGQFKSCICSAIDIFTNAGRLESAIAQLGPDPVETGMRKSLPDNMCSLSDVPDDYVKDLDLRQVKVDRAKDADYV